MQDITTYGSESPFDESKQTRIDGIKAIGDGVKICAPIAESEAE